MVSIAFGGGFTGGQNTIETDLWGGDKISWGLN